ncbi:MAG: type II toxin-antitoxin system HicA family toxin [Caldilineaceae bacterium]|nr:type II toxin-antitoxin system HicA family toxin [Caldilineaceae bacterium]
MSRLPMVTPQDMCRVLEELGFTLVRQRGSHRFYRHNDGRSTVVPFHAGEDLGRGLVRSIMRDIEISRDEFIKLL